MRVRVCDKDDESWKFGDDLWDEIDNDMRLDSHPSLLSLTASSSLCSSGPPRPVPSRSPRSPMAANLVDLAGMRLAGRWI